LRTSFGGRRKIGAGKAAVTVDDGDLEADVTDGRMLAPDHFGERLRSIRLVVRSSRQLQQAQGSP
jgi:hypothetical protein